MAESLEVVIARIDERTNMMQLNQSEMLRHLEMINGHIKDHEVRIINVERTGKDNRKIILWIAGLLLTSVVSFTTWALKRVGIM